MSARALNWAWGQRPKTSTEKLVLAAIADRSDDEGISYPSIGWVVNKCQPISEPTVKRAIASLAEQGLIEKTRRLRKRNGDFSVWLYRLPLEKSAQIISDPCAGVAGELCAEITGDLAETFTTNRKSLSDERDGQVRSRDDVWDALVAWLGYEPKTRTERTGWNRVVRELKEAGATGETVKAAGKAYDGEWKGLERSPYALMKWWSRFLTEGDGSNVRAAVLSWARNVGVHLEAAGLDDELLSWAGRGADDVTLAEAKRIATTPIERLAAAS